MGFALKLKEFLFADNEPEGIKNGEYEKKDSLLTQTELVFFNKLQKLYNKKYHLQAQISLRSVVNKTYYSKYINELFKDIDFGIFDKKTLKPLVLIELNDYTHNYNNRQERDAKVKDILYQCGIPFLTFYTDKPNKLTYLKEKINRELKKYKKGILTKNINKTKVYRHYEINDDTLPF
ncbi:MAG: DUF2726 domain-containing protein [Clostridia bacterium]|nr:DUF2726 domain-containing protein [Clostridia bacterium]